MQADLAAADALCRSRGLGGLSRVQALAGGAVNGVYRALAAQAGPVVVRVNRRDPDDAKFSRERAVAALLARVAPQVPVPEVLLVEEDPARTPHPVHVARWIDGVAGDSPEVAARFLPHAALGALIAGVHAVTTPHFGWPRPATGDARDRDWAAYLGDLARRRLVDLATVNALRPAEISALAAWLEARLAERQGEGRRVRPALVHADLHWGNVLLDPRATPARIVGLLDFEWAMGADPGADWAWATRAVRHATAVRRAYVGAGGTLPDGRRAALYRVVQSLEILAVAARHWGRDHPAYAGHLAILRGALGRRRERPA